MGSYFEFELDLTEALRERLPTEFDRLQGAPLTLENVVKVPQTQGVYMLLERGIPMYIGKTDAAHGFQDRIRRHWYTLSARHNIDLANVWFKAVRVMVFTTVNVESILIEQYIGANPMAWQNSGFGSNDPGHNREFQQPSKFDIDYPINLQIPIDFVQPGTRPVLDVLLNLKHYLPYDLRFETDVASSRKNVHFTKGHIDQRLTMIDVPQRSFTVRELLQLLINALPDGWVATVLPGRVILYKEPTTYRHQVEQLTKS
ncbi:Eco29kI family restriction endonuclease [Dyella sp. 2HG41-7]|uniref:Eco29kI family restriction endonuclease n=1 Tax=Dyella sp. 2HG41-7 TaxID=2883239 RepID=UPI001F3F1296|nr:Eco29kI family restriction endonuclease [Dyella sp. 2HG41-7]